MADIVYRRMVLSDAEEVAEMERAIFTMPWSYNSIVHELTENKAARYLVAEADGHVIGYAGVWIVLDEGHITNVAVREEFRGQGIGQELMSRLMQYASNLGAAFCMLEVRRSNERAQHVYYKLGFVDLGVRKRYYEDNHEDALILVCDHLPEPQEDFTEEETIRIS